MTDASRLLRRFALALCTWREARGEPRRGKLFVAQVIENRVNDHRWPDTYVGVITQPLQFSAFNHSDPNESKWPTETDPAWVECVDVVDSVLDVAVPFTRANHYHAIGSAPKWARADKVVARIGHHIFYEL